MAHEMLTNASVSSFQLLLEQFKQSECNYEAIVGV